MLIIRRMDTKGFTVETCTIRNILDRFGDKWSILVMIVLQQNTIMRFNEMSKAIPDISQKMLTVTLRTLETDGLIKRTIYAQVPPKVEYELTGMGISLLEHVNGLVKWAVENTSAINTSRQEYAEAR